MIGMPTVTPYGSSFGKFNGSRLKDYKSIGPDTDKLNSTNEQDVVESSEFEQSVKDFILARLGAPTVRVELTNYQIKTCIDEAISKLEYHAPFWMTQYAVFDASSNINVYELPEQVARNLTHVWYRNNLFTLGATPGSLEYDFAIMFFTNTGLFNNYNVGQYMLMQMYLKQISKVLGLGTSWTVVGGKYLHLNPVPDSSQAVILEFRGLDTNTVIPAYRNWIQRYSLACAKEILGRVRSKYQTLPGPGGGSRLDGEALLVEAREDKQILLEELISEIENPPFFILA